MSDLNAHNVLVDGSGTIWLLDFDRGRLRKPAMAWQQAISRACAVRSSSSERGPARCFDARFWHPLLAAYHRALADRVRAE